MIIRLRAVQLVTKEQLCGYGATVPWNVASVMWYRLTPAHPTAIYGLGTVCDLGHAVWPEEHGGT